MTEHKFKIGEMVFYRPRVRGIDAPVHRPFQITAQLALIGSEPQYQIQSEHEEQERAAGETELRPVQTIAAPTYR